MIYKLYRGYIIVLILLMLSLNAKSNEDSTAFRFKAGLYTYLPGVSYVPNYEHLLALEFQINKWNVYASGWLYKPLNASLRRAIPQVGFQYTILKLQNSRVYSDLSYSFCRYQNSSSYTLNYNYKDPNYNDPGLNEVFQKVKSYNINIQIGYALGVGMSKRVDLHAKFGLTIQRNQVVKLPVNWGPNFNGYVDSERIRPMGSLGVSYAFIK